MESCEVCGRSIGKLETPHLHEDRVVCAECKTRLSRIEARASVPAEAWRSINWVPALLVLAIIGCTAVAAYFTILRPMQTQTTRLQFELVALGKTVDSKSQELAALAKTVDSESRELAALAKTVDSESRELVALAKTVDHNAEVANQTSERISKIARTLSEVAALAENANRHAHSHSRF